MTIVEAVEITLAARRAAKRIGHTFVLDHAKLARLGLSPDQIAAVEFHTAEIEQAISASMSQAAARDAVVR